MALGSDLGENAVKTINQVTIPELVAALKTIIDYAESKLSGKRIVISIEEKP